MFRADRRLDRNFLFYAVSSKVQATSYAPRGQSQINNYYPAIGVLKTIWRDRNGKQQYYTYGTAFALTENVLATCTHNIYSHTRKRTCSEIIFLPGKKSGKLENTDTVYTCTNIKNIKFKVPQSSMDHTTLKEQLAIFKLDPGQSIPCLQYIKIGSLNSVREGQELTVVGYPSESYPKKQNLSDVDVNRMELTGQLYSIEGHIINHTMPTMTGHSGSPILARDSQGTYYAVGIHTHKTIDQYFSGLYFNSEVLRTVARFQAELNCRNTSIFHHIIKGRFQPEQQGYDGLKGDYSLEETITAFSRDHDEVHDLYSIVDMHIGVQSLASDKCNPQSNNSEMMQFDEEQPIDIHNTSSDTEDDSNGDEDSTTTTNHGNSQHSFSQQEFQNDDNFSIFSGSGDSPHLEDENQSYSQGE